MQSKHSGRQFMSRRTFVQTGATLAFVACSAGTVWAQTAPAGYPSREIELLIPFAPGGGVDLFGRTIARVLNSEKIVTRPIQVLNKPGAGGATGIAEMVHVRKGNPHSLLGIATHVFITPMMAGTPYSYKHLTPIAKIFTEHQMMVVRTESPIKSLKEIEGALRKDVGSLRFGGATVGTWDHMTAAKFAQVVGGDPSKITYMAYSGGESNAAILGGHVDVGLGGLDLMDLVEAGRMRVLAVNSPKRLGGRFKDVPTFAEQGYEVVNENWRGLFAPPGVPDAVVEYLAHRAQEDVADRSLEDGDGEESVGRVVRDRHLPSLSPEGGGGVPSARNEAWTSEVRDPTEKAASVLEPIFTVALVPFAAFYIWQAMQVTEPPRNIIVGPRTFPLLIGAFMLVVSAVLAVRQLRAAVGYAGRRTGPVSGGVPLEDEEMPIRDWTAVGLVLSRPAWSFHSF